MEGYLSEVSAHGYIKLTREVKIVVIMKPGLEPMFLTYFFFFFFPSNFLQIVGKANSPDIAIIDMAKLIEQDYLWHLF